MSATERQDTNTNLIINFLPIDFDEEELKKLFGTVGPIKSVRIMKNRKTSRSKGYGFVKFHDPDHARLAIQRYNGMEIQHKNIKVALSRPGGTRSGCNLFVSNLPKKWCSDELGKYFKRYGPLLECRVLKNGNQESRRCGFVRFDQARDANRAVMELDGFLPPLAKSPITVKLAERPAHQDKNKKGNYNPHGIGAGQMDGDHHMHHPWKTTTLDPTFYHNGSGPKQMQAHQAMIPNHLGMYMDSFDRQKGLSQGSVMAAPASSNASGEPLPDVQSNPTSNPQVPEIGSGSSVPEQTAGNESAQNTIHIPTPPQLPPSPGMPKPQHMNPAQQQIPAGAPDANLYNMFAPPSRFAAHYHNSAYAQALGSPRFSPITLGSPVSITSPVSGLGFVYPHQHENFSPIGNVSSHAPLPTVMDNNQMRQDSFNFTNVREALPVNESQVQMQAGQMPIIYPQMPQDQSGAEVSSGNKANQQNKDTVFVSNIPLFFDEFHLQNLFATYGEVKLTTLQRDNSGYSLGMGFISFASPESARRCVHGLNGSTLYDKRISVRF